MNNVSLLGRITANTELKYTQSDIPVTSFCIAVDRRFQKDGERITDFINCVAWRNTAEFITRNFKKGDPIAVIGEIQTRKYTDRDGNKRTAVEVVINDARFVPANNSGNNDSTPPASANFADLGDIDDTLPF